MSNLRFRNTRRVFPTGNSHSKYSNYNSAPDGRMLFVLIPPVPGKLFTVKHVTSFHNAGKTFALNAEI